MRLALEAMGPASGALWPLLSNTTEEPKTPYKHGKLSQQSLRANSTETHQLHVITQGTHGHPQLRGGNEHDPNSDLVLNLTLLKLAWEDIYV